MTSDSSHLPERIAKLFKPRPPLAYLAPSDIPIENRKNVEITGILALLPQLKEYVAQYPFQEPTSVNYLQRKAKKEKEAKRIQTLAQAIALWDPEKDPHIQGNPYKMLFVARLAYGVTEVDLQKEFAVYGPIERVRLVRDRTGKSRGYAFVLFEKEKDLARACKEANGKVIAGRSVVVDVERGRTVRGWKPRRLGGGLGGRGGKGTVEERRPRHRSYREGDYGYRGSEVYSEYRDDRDRGRDRYRESRYDRIDRDRERDRDRDRERERYDRPERAPRAY